MPAAADEVVHQDVGRQQEAKLGRKEKADEMGFKNRSLIEMRRDVVEGMSRTALREGCALIVLARGLTTKAGRYGDQLIERSCPVPIMMLKLEGEPSW